MVVGAGSIGGGGIGGCWPRTNRVAEVRVFEIGLALGVEFEEGVSVGGRVGLRGRLELRIHRRKISVPNRYFEY